MDDARVTFSRTVPVRLVCARCSARYEYDRVMTVKREVVGGRLDLAEREAEAALDREQAERDVAVVRCPACGKFAPGALANRLAMLAFTLGGAVVCAAVAVGVLVIAAEAGKVFWLIGLLAAIGVPVFLILTLIFLLSPTTHTTRLTLN